MKHTTSFIKLTQSNTHPKVAATAATLQTQESSMNQVKNAKHNVVTSSPL